MPTIALIVTGDMERVALPTSLKKVFQTADFTAQQVDCFTSARVVWPPAQRPGMLSNIEKYVTALVAALVPGQRKGSPPDFVFGFDDLEMANHHQPDAVITAFRLALKAELQRREANLNRASYVKLEAAVRERCSFHLLVPMCEAYFYADPGALQAAGCTRPPQIVPDRDVELFTVTEPDYLVDLSTQPFPLPTWAIDLALRPLHPKRYLEFLLGSYQETAQGTAGLCALDWRRVLSRPDHTRFLRSFFQDLAYALDMDLSLFPGQTHPLTSDWKNKHRLLRNF
ncbi:hypothetical protein AYO44_06340 [Planctomycetaceae bacterium SCGC AG-212-F19]|nr:hypothetical protein AYO44_06340 [Planctomycetaceae bacterium SCGC AG-212-F19]